GGEIRARVTVTGDTNGMTLSGRLVDTFGRQIDRVREVTLGPAGAVELVMHNDQPITLAANLWVTLSRGEAALDRELARVWIDLPEDRDELIFCAWYAWDHQPAAYYGLQWVRDLGVDTYVSLGGAWRAENAAYADIRHGPENVERVAPQNTDDTLVRVPCLTDPEYRAKVEDRVRTYARSVRQFGVLEWSLGDESTLGRRDYCTSPTCLESFRQFLQRSYPSLQALNESWGTNYGDWEEVVPATLEQVQGGDRLGPWLDHRRYMEWLFTDYHAWLREIITQEIPGARVGISGTPQLNSYSGHDWWQLMQYSLEHLSGYGGLQRELQRSFMRPGTFYSTFLGYDYKDNNEQRARYAPWDLLFHGANGINYYTLVSGTLNCPLIRPDGSQADHAKWFFEEVRELKAGPGRLLIQGKYENDGIAVLYSPPSIHVATAVGLFDSRDRLRNYNINLSNLGKILQESHYQYDFIAQEQMEDGDLARYKVLLLPWSSAISESEAQAIEQFVRAGGTVIADSFCGVRDDHGAPRPMMDRLFGIRQPLEPPELAPAELALTPPAPAWLDLGDLEQVPVASGSPGLELDGGSAHARVGEMPALIVNQVGQGRAVFLNCSFSNYAEVRETGAAGETIQEIASPEEVTRPIRELVQALLAGAGVSAPITVEGERGLGPQLEVSRLALGQGRLIGLVRSIQAGAIDRDDRLRCKIALPEPAHVYDCRAGKYLGSTAEIIGEVPRGIAQVYAALPYRVTGLTVDAPPALSAGDQIKLSVKVQAEGGVPGTHVIRLTLTGPDGKVRPCYSRNLTAPEGYAP
ncbi:MAG TPA: beta-galactosidase, partial [Armatimonadota bacterium]|nr:beta-galactosidase [Armatimonadota bacterium]